MKLTIFIIAVLSVVKLWSNTIPSNTVESLIRDIPLSAEKSEEATSIIERYLDHQRLSRFSTTYRDSVLHEVLLASPRVEKIKKWSLQSGESYLIYTQNLLDIKRTLSPDEFYRFITLEGYRGALKETEKSKDRVAKQPSESAKRSRSTDESAKDVTIQSSTTVTRTQQVTVRTDSHSVQEDEGRRRRRR